MSTVKSEALELKSEARELIKAASRQATIRPRTPEGRSSRTRVAKTRSC